MQTYVKVKIDDLKQYDELCCAYLRTRNYFGVKLNTLDQYGGRYGYTRALSSSHEITDHNSHLDAAHILKCMGEYNIDLNHDGDDPKIWTASRISVGSGEYVPTISASDTDFRAAVMKVVIKYRGQSEEVEMPV
jgi:hypothetical protein